MPNSLKTFRSIRLTSVEPLETLFPQVQEIANQFGFVLNTEEQKRASAPFCGYDLYHQNMSLSSNEQLSVEHQIDNCIDMIGVLTETSVADGYLEILN